MTIETKKELRIYNDNLLTGKIVAKNKVKTDSASKRELTVILLVFTLL